MITLLGAVIFMTVIAMFEKDGSTRDGIEPAPGGPPRSRRDHPA
jgi:hypothetical protein